MLLDSFAILTVKQFLLTLYQFLKLGHDVSISQPEVFQLRSRNAVTKFQKSIQNEYKLFHCEVFLGFVKQIMHYDNSPLKECSETNAGIKRC